MPRRNYTLQDVIAQLDQQSTAQTNNAQVPIMLLVLSETVQVSEDVSWTTTTPGTDTYGTMIWGGNQWH